MADPSDPARDLVHGPDRGRPDLHLSVWSAATKRDKDREVVAAAVDRAIHDGAGIVFVGAPARAEALAAELAARGVAAAAGHDGLDPTTRSLVHHAFGSGDLDLVVATSTFGAAIRRGDVRFVLHADPPRSLDDYQREIAQAGRDGGPAVAVLFHCPDDLSRPGYLGARRRTRPDDLAAVAARLTGAADRSRICTVAELAQELDRPPRRIQAVLRRLADAGAVATGADPSGPIDVVDADALTAANRKASAADSVRRRAEHRAEMVRGYVETPDCRRRFLLTYLGVPHPGGCGRCDACDAADASTPGRRTSPAGERPAAGSPFAHGGRVRHVAYGEGQIVRVEATAIVVRFDEFGYRTLDLGIVERGALLEPIGLT